MGNQILKAERVRIELVLAGTTYEIELAEPDKLEFGVDERGELVAALDLEIDTRELSGAGGWTQTIGLNSATVKLTAHGKIVKAERRQTT